MSNSKNLMTNSSSRSDGITHHTTKFTVHPRHVDTYKALVINELLDPGTQTCMLSEVYPNEFNPGDIVEAHNRRGRVIESTRITILSPHREQDEPLHYILWDGFFPIDLGIGRNRDLRFDEIQPVHPLILLAECAEDVEDQS